MGRRSAYTVQVEDGREIGFGLVIRSEDTYSVQFKDLDGVKYVVRSTGESARPRAISKAEKIIQAHYKPVELTIKNTSWDDTIAQLEKHMTADGLRKDTIKDYADTLRQVRTAAVCPSAVSAGIAQQWCNSYLTSTYTRAKPTPEKSPTGRKPRKVREVKEYARNPRTLISRVRKLNAIWNKYLTKRLGICDQNPWETVDLPKVDKKPIRTLSDEQVTRFFDWIKGRWHGWELPYLFFETKAITACRLLDIASALTSGLVIEKDQHIITYVVKQRRTRKAVIPVDLWEALKRISGPKYVWQSYSRDMGQYLDLRGVPRHRINPQFDPERLVWWAKDEIDDFNKAHPDQPGIQSHDFRKRAITEAHRAGIDMDTAASGAGMTPGTARGYYAALDEQAASAKMTATLGSILRPRSGA